MLSAFFHRSFAKQCSKFLDRNNCVYKNLYGDAPSDLSSAMSRGDWTNSSKMVVDGFLIKLKSQKFVAVVVLVSQLVPNGPLYQNQQPHHII